MRGSLQRSTLDIQGKPTHRELSGLDHWATRHETMELFETRDSRVTLQSGGITVSITAFPRQTTVHGSSG